MRLTPVESWLIDRLAAGPVLATQIVAEAKAVDITEVTLRRAKARLGIRSVREFRLVGRRRSLWRLPSTAD